MISRNGFKTVYYYRKFVQMLFFMLSQSLAVDLLENFDERAFFYLVFESSIEEKAYAK